MSKAQDVADLLGNDPTRFVVGTDPNAPADESLEALALACGAHEEEYYPSPNSEAVWRYTFDDGSVIEMHPDRWIVSHVMTQEEYEAGKELEMLRVMEGLQSP